MTSSRDRRLVLYGFGVVLACIVAFSIFAPAHDDSDPSPTTYNSGSAGTKAAFLLMQELGYQPARWDQPFENLGNVDAAKTTLVLAEPIVSGESAKAIKADVANFLSRGGRVLVTGGDAAYLLPDARAGAPTRFYGSLCRSTPVGQDPLARAGRVSILDVVRWTATGPSFRVSQMCGNDAVVVSYKYGNGEAVWWSSPAPLTNRGLKEDASLRLVLASLGVPGRRVLFDEYLHGERASIWETAKGLPIAQLGWQCAVVALLLVLSFGRRNGPLRTPVRLPRSSPLEFAESMGQLYRKAGATHAAVDGARRRLLKFLEEQCGVPREVLRSSPQAVVAAVEERLGGEWSRLGKHLAQAAEAEYNAITLASTLELVKVLDRDQQDLAEKIRFGQQVVKAW